MDIPAAPTPCYLAEWYAPEFTGETLEHNAGTLNDCAASVSAEGTPVQLVALLAVPTDEVIFGIFTADAATVVVETCDRAGMPPQRLTIAAGLQITQADL